ncbi:MAG: PaREP1 family protein [Desulfurococcales archaeon]|jgi:hypothetical protein|nr:PaREP1 family protein [Desulfurococcales archaeon]
MSSAEAIKLPRSIMEKLYRKACKLGVSLEVYVLELVLRDLEPSDHVKIYTDAARDLLRQAREEFKKGNFRQAAEKIWGAAALAVKAYAEWRKGRRLSSHGELWEYKRIMEREVGEWVYGSWNAAHSMNTASMRAGAIEKM